MDLEKYCDDLHIQQKKIWDSVKFDVLFDEEEVNKFREKKKKEAEFFLHSLNNEDTPK